MVLVSDLIYDMVTEPIYVDQPYIMEIYTEGTINYSKPVDFMLNEINIPLQNKDISFICKDEEKTDLIYVNQFNMDIYYPPSSKFTLPTGIEYKIIEYKDLKYYNGIYHVKAICKLVDNGKHVMYTVDNSSIRNKVMKELNNILESNDVIKNILPQYSYDWFMYNNKTIEDSKKYEAKKYLDMIYTIEDDENTTKQKIFKSVIESEYSNFPISTLNDIYKFSIDATKSKYSIIYNEIEDDFRMKPILNWAIYMIINKDNFANFNLNAIKLKFKTNENSVSLLFESKENQINGYDITIKIIMPELSLYDYIIYLTQVSNSDPNFLCYNIDNLRIAKIKKYDEESDGTIIDGPNANNQYVVIMENNEEENIPEDIEFINAITDYFDALVAIFESIMNCEYSEAAFDNLPDIIANIDSNYPALS